MAATVKMFAFGGVANVAKSNVGAGSDNIILLKQPYLARETITASASAQSTAAATGAAGSKVLLVQVQVGKRIALRVTVTGTTNAADTNDVELVGDTLVEWGEGYTASMVEIT